MCYGARLTVAKHWSWLPRAVKGKQEVSPREKWAAQSVSRGTASREHEETDTSRNDRVKSISYIRAVPIGRRSISREHTSVVDLRDLLEVKSRRADDWRSSRGAWWRHPSSRSARAKRGWLTREGSNLVGSKTYHLLKRICMNTGLCLFNCPFVRVGVLVSLRLGIALHVACIDWSDVTRWY